MSLINEALKKAQPQRNSPGTVQPEAVPAPPPHYSPPRRKRSYLWGFLLAVLLVGLFSAIVSTYLVYQVLGSGEQAESDGGTPAPIASNADPQVTSEIASPGIEQKTVNQTASSAPPEDRTAPEPDPASMNSPSTAASLAGVESEEATAPVASARPTATPTNREAWERLQSLEIRGIMSGGTKVLIFDLVTGKTRSYTPGEIIDGALGLKVSSIDPNVISFEDYDGATLTKPF
jgi:hypothetical protein